MTKPHDGALDSKPNPTTAKSVHMVATSPANRNVPAIGSVGPIDIDKLDDNPFQPRRSLDESALCELMASIREHGLLQPIVVCREGDRFQIIAGHRRTAAIRRLRDQAMTDTDRRRFSSVLAHARDAATDQQKAVLALVENLQREDINPLEAAAGLLRLQEIGALNTAKDLASATGVKEDRVRRLLRLNDSPQVVKDGVSKGLLVSVLDTDGNFAKTDGGKYRREHRNLDLMSGLEFARLHKHLLSKAPKRADERTARVIQRALQEGWHFRRIQNHVANIIDGRETTDDALPGASAKKTASPFTTDGRQLVLQLELLSNIDAEARTELVRALSDVLRKLGVRPGDLDLMSPQATLPKSSKNTSENSSTLSSKHLEVIKEEKLEEKLEVTRGR